MNKKMPQESINECFQRWQKNNPKPTTELKYSSNFELLISVILSAQATDKSVNKATEKLYKLANTPEAILDLGLEQLKYYIKTIGLFNNKATNIMKTCEQLITKYNGIVPNTREALESLAGVGRKTANVILNTAFNQPTIAVDTHIFRVGNRTGIALGKNVLQVEKELMKNIPNKFLLSAHHWLVLHGRYICTAKNQKCANCLIKDLCVNPINI